MNSTNRHDENNQASTLQDLFDRFPGEVLSEGDGWVTNCPSKAHKHVRSLLGIRVGWSGRVLLSCRTGCSPEAVLDAVGLTMSDLTAITPPLPPAPHVARRLEVRRSARARLGGEEMAPHWDESHCHHGWDDVEDDDFEEGLEEDDFEEEFEEETSR